MDANQVDNPNLMGSTEGGPLEPAFSNYSNDTTTEDMFGSPKNFLGVVAKTAKSAYNSKPITGDTANDYGFRTIATAGLFRKADPDGPGLEQTKPPMKSMPAVSENPQEVWYRWHSMMKNFGYNNGK